ncbi:hypothetical protein ACVWW3_007238 [Bradyrhizobium sp. LM2.9]
MKAKVFLSLILLCGGLAAPSARAGDVAPAASAAPPACELPSYLLTSESQLPKVADAVKAGKPLEILVIGSRSTTIPASEDASYPARMQAILKDKLPPSETVHVSVEIQSKKTAEEAAASFVKLMEAKTPTLVIWQTGTVDAIRAIDPDDFRGAVTEGVAALQKAGADVVLMNLQYSPRTETMISVPPYLDNICGWWRRSTISRCSIVSRSCGSGMIRGSSTCSARRAGLSWRNRSMIALAGRWHSSSSTLPIWSRPSSKIEV